MTILEIKKKSSLQKSSMIDRLVYEKDSCELTVFFEKGSVYYYKDVPSNVVKGFSKAPSIGKYFTDKIKGKYSSTKLEASNEH